MTSATFIDTFIDETTVTPTERLCFMILDHMRRFEDTLDNVKKEFNRIEVYRVFDKIDEYVERSVPNGIFKDDNKLTLIASICVHKLSIERLTHIWKMCFASRDVNKVLNFIKCLETNDKIQKVVKINSIHLNPIELVMMNDSFTKNNLITLLQQLTREELLEIEPIIFIQDYQNNQ